MQVSAVMTVHKHPIAAMTVVYGLLGRFRVHLRDNHVLELLLMWFRFNLFVVTFSLHRLVCHLPVRGASFVHGSVSWSQGSQQVQEVSLKDGHETCSKFWAILGFLSIPYCLEEMVPL